jgi:RimJ/RimL family protein N-acetyltransferase
MTQMTSSIHSYIGAAEIHFIPGDTLNVSIFTDRLYIRSVQAADAQLYATLYKDPEVMAKYHDGQPKTREYIQNRIETSWAKRWREYDPYSSFAVFNKATHEFLGMITFGYGDQPGESEMAGLAKKEFWNQGLATEALHAMVKEYAPATLREGYLLEGKPLARIVATARVDNEAANKLLEGLGMQLQKTDEKFGGLRNHYALNLSQLEAITAQKAAKEFTRSAPKHTLAAA